MNQKYSEYLSKVLVVDRYFLNEDECEFIKSRVLENYSLWQRVPKIQTFDFFPLGMYTHRLDDKQKYIDNVKVYNPILEKNFLFFYQKIQYKLESIFNIKVSFKENLNLPGFHIGTATLPENFTNYHVDRFVILKQLVDFEKIFSIIVPISLTGKGDGLLIKRNNKVTTLDYTLGMMGMWDGDLLHSIKPFVVEDNNFRITMQLHLGIDSKNNGFIFW